jgi:polysaccharide export outer membrane protein
MTFSNCSGRFISLFAGLCVSASVGVLGLSAEATEIPVSQSLDRSVRVNPPQAEAAYTLGAGDRINIDILQVSQYSGETDVLVDGSVQLAGVGRVSVDGMTLEEATNAIATAYSTILRRPVITVTLVSARPLQIGIAGEVNHPGSYTLTLEESQFPTLTSLLETAGGITLAADLRRVQIRRSQTNRTAQVIQVDLWELLQTGDLRNDITLRDGDTVFIPTATDVDLAEVPQLAAASFASNENLSINVAVVGEVYRPGPYTVAGGARTGEAGVPGGTSGGSSSDRLPTVTSAIQVAGGIKPLADIRHIQVRRPTREGSEQVIPVDLWDLLQTGNLRQDVILQEGDTIYIPGVPDVDPAEATAIAVASFSPDTIRVNVVGEVERAGTVDLPPNTPLNQAVLAAGGFTTRARRSSVRLVRLNPDGTVVERSVPIDFAQGINEASNPMLRNNDVIIVGRSTISGLSDTVGTVLAPLFTIFNYPLQFLRIFDSFSQSGGR